MDAHRTANCGVRKWNLLLDVGLKIRAHAYGHDDETSASLRRDRSAVGLHNLHGASSQPGARRTPRRRDSSLPLRLCPGRGMTRTPITASLRLVRRGTDDV